MEDDVIAQLESFLSTNPSESDLKAWLARLSPEQHLKCASYLHRIGPQSFLHVPNPELAYRDAERLSDNELFSNLAQALGDTTQITSEGKIGLVNPRVNPEPVSRFASLVNEAVRRGYNREDIGFGMQRFHQANPKFSPFMDEGWRSFEKLVARIHISLCRDADVKWSEKLIDSSGTERQIDVTIRTRIGPHRVLGIIECKDHKRPVTITDVEAFISLKNDLHASFAVMVSNSGYQEGALKKAELHDIRLWTLQEAQEASWREEIRNFELRYNMFDEIQFDPPIPADAFTQKTSYLSFAAVAISDGARKITLARALAAAIEHATLSGFSIPFWLDVNYEDGCAITMQGKTFPLRCLKVHFADQIAIQQHKNIRVPLGGTYEFKQTDGETHVVNERDLPPIEE